MNPTRRPAATTLLFIVAVALRLLFCFAVYPRIAAEYGPGDDYDVIARNLVAGNGYTIDGRAAAAERLPLYAFFLAAHFALFGDADWPWQVTQSVLGALSCVIVYLLAEGVAAPAAAFAAGGLCVVHPTLLLYTARPLTETLYVLLLLLFVHAAVRGRDLWCGVWFGCGALVKTTAIIHLIALVGALVAERWRQPSSAVIRLSRLASVLVVSVLVISPWVGWSLSQSGEIGLRTATGGRALYHGLYISGHVSWTTPTADLNRDAELSLWNELERHGVERNADVCVRDRLAGSFARAWMADHRTEMMLVWLRNLVLTWYLGRSRLSMAIHALLHVPLLMAAAIGAWRLWRDAPHTTELVVLCVTLVIGYTAFHAFVQPAVRYILPVVPLAAVLAAGAGRLSRVRVP